MPGRLGNFINGELWGRVDPNFPFAMLFPGSRTEDILLLQTNPQWQSIFDTYGVLAAPPITALRAAAGRCGAVYYPQPVYS
ncbi:prolipoprotein diacylglyceryl transferase [Escherichia coli]|uniref:Prolipoprotein diacylglyceryl transferase n=1 Tax=Escherichia coli TaxID=562 RepID=A0A377K3E6_ECOLX|nr:prolipoprotein diacylglyceryl transferase [Escherichia coli]